MDSSILWEDSFIPLDVDDIEDIRISVDGEIIDTWIKDPENESVILVDIPTTYICEKHIVELSIIKLTQDLVDYDEYLENTVYVSDISYHNHFLVFGYDLGNNGESVTCNEDFTIYLYFNSPSLDNSFDNSTDSQSRIWSNFIQYREPYTNNLHTYYSAGGVNSVEKRVWNDEGVMGNFYYVNNYEGEIKLEEFSIKSLPYNASNFSFPKEESNIIIQNATALLFTDYRIENIIGSKKKPCLCDEESDIYTLISNDKKQVNVDDEKVFLYSKRVLNRGIYNKSDIALKNEQIEITDPIWFGQLHSISFTPKENQEYKVKSILTYYDQDKPVLQITDTTKIDAKCFASIYRHNHKDWHLINNSSEKVSYKLEKHNRGNLVFHKEGFLDIFQCVPITFEKDGVYKVTFTKQGKTIVKSFVVDTHLQECLVQTITDIIIKPCYAKTDILLLGTIFWLAIVFYHKVLEFENNKKLFPILYQQNKLEAIELEEILEAFEIYCLSCIFEEKCC